ncbi:MAG: YraN family protein [Clostridiales bacterium]|nr:YraN family protein [Clostridiales bacterium]
MRNDVDRRLGAWGEAVVAQWLVQHGYEVLGHHLSYREGEIDLLARKSDILAVVEVKLRTGSFATGGEAVTLRKQERIRRAMGRYLSQHPEMDSYYIRFDVCQITAPQGMGTQRPAVEYLENAFY